VDSLKALDPKRPIREATKFSKVADIRTNLVCQLFDHLVGTTLYRLRHGNAERLGGPEVDDQFDFR